MTNQTNEGSRLYNLDAERATLGACLLDPAAAATVAGIISSGSFYPEKHRLIYGALQQLTDAGQPCDIITAGDALQRSGDLERVGGMAYLSELLDACPATSTAGHYAQAVAEAARLRALRSALASVLDNVTGGDQSADELTRQAEGLLYKLSDGSAGEDQQRSAAEYLPAFLDEISKANTPAKSTGFPRLDYLLDGGLYEGLYILGAISSLGKTTFALQLADQLAQRGHDVLFFSLEMSRAELIAKSISRQTFLIAGEDQSQYAKTARGIMAAEKQKYYTDKEQRLIKQAIGKYREYAGRLYILESAGAFGVEHIRQAVQRHVITTGRRPVVFVDYLQILAPADPRSSDKQNTDKAVLELKRISREHKTPVFAISSFNRDSYKKSSSNRGRVSMADFKESGAIEYSADVLLGLEFASAGGEGYNEEPEKQKARREVTLRILKNRNGRAFVDGYFIYYALFNCFKENGEEDGSADPFGGEDRALDFAGVPMV